MVVMLAAFAGAPAFAAGSCDYAVDSSTSKKLGSVCKKKMSEASKSGRANRSSREMLCPIKDFEPKIQSRLGPFREFARAAMRLFEATKNIVILAGAFMFLWIIVQGAWRGEAEWMKLWWLVLGIVIMGGAESVLGWFIGGQTCEDIKSGSLYVDCRAVDRGRIEPLYECESGDSLSNPRAVPLVYLQKFKKARPSAGSAGPADPPTAKYF